jgi:hypothetical protein
MKLSGLAGLATELHRRRSVFSATSSSEVEPILASSAPTEVRRSRRVLHRYGVFSPLIPPRPSLNRPFSLSSNPIEASKKPPSDALKRPFPPRYSYQRSSANLYPSGPPRPASPLQYVVSSDHSSRRVETDALPDRP